MPRFIAAVRAKYVRESPHVSIGKGALHDAGLRTAAYFTFYISFVVARKHPSVPWKPKQEELWKVSGGRHTRRGEAVMCDAGDPIRGSGD